MATDQGAPALLLDNVVKTYGPIRAVDGVSLQAYSGEFIALLGPNGAGKSTLFQLLSGLFVPDSGRIAVMGHDMLRNPVPALARLGIVFQQPTLDLELTVTANLLFHAGLHGIPRAVAQARIADELARLGLADRAHDKAAQLSGGNRRRVELARALLHEPSVLLMDEATVGLDPASRSDLLKLLLTMRRERSVAVLWATHLCDEVPDADRVIVLHRGKVLTDTTPAQLVTRAERRDHRGGVPEDDRAGWTRIVTAWAAAVGVPMGLNSTCGASRRSSLNSIREVPGSTLVSGCCVLRAFSDSFLVSSAVRSSASPS